jgi:hypothetical protein
VVFLPRQVAHHFAPAAILTALYYLLAHFPAQAGLILRELSRRPGPDRDDHARLIRCLYQPDFTAPETLGLTRCMCPRYESVTRAAFLDIMGQNWRGTLHASDEDSYIREHLARHGGHGP